MTYEEAVKLGKDWTQGHDISLDGWRSVIAILLQRNRVLEEHMVDLTKAMRRLQSENEALSLDLGFREKCFELPPQPQLQTIADIIKECERKI